MNKTNRKKLNGMSLYDLVMTYVTERLHMCPISFFGDKKKSTKHCLSVKCSQCFNDWLNEEAK